MASTSVSLVVPQFELYAACGSELARDPGFDISSAPIARKRAPSVPGMGIDRKAARAREDFP